MSKPARPDLKFDSLDAMVNDADQLRSGRYEKAGEWDLAMILDHLGKCMASPFLPDAKNLPWPLAAISRQFIHRMTRKQIYPSFKLPAPKIIRPTSGLSIDVSYPAFVAATNHLKSLTVSTLNTPPFGVLSTPEFIQLQLLHAAHHLSFLRRVD